MDISLVHRWDIASTRCISKEFEDVSFTLTRYIWILWRCLLHCEDMNFALHRDYCTTFGDPLQKNVYNTLYFFLPLCTTICILYQGPMWRSIHECSMAEVGWCNDTSFTSAVWLWKWIYLVMWPASWDQSSCLHCVISWNLHTRSVSCLPQF